MWPGLILPKGRVKTSTIGIKEAPQGWIQDRSTIVKLAVKCSRFSVRDNVEHRQSEGLQILDVQHPPPPSPTSLPDHGMSHHVEKMARTKLRPFVCAFVDDWMKLLFNPHHSYVGCWKLVCTFSPCVCLVVHHSRRHPYAAVRTGSMLKRTQSF